MRHVVAVSGGKDSTALACWALGNVPEPTFVFCDTGWEHGITYAYLAELNEKLFGGALVTIRNARHPGGFVDVCVYHHRAPSARVRFCTSDLKVRPMIEWLRTIDDDVTVYQGIRADESAARAKMAESEWNDDYDALVVRPLLRWTAADCFAIAERYGIRPNPLYLLGASRVGCFPCVMVNMRELKAYLGGHLGPELRARVLELEARLGRSFFEPTYIPARFCTGFDEKSGKPFPWAADVFRYIESVDMDQLPLFPARSCMSVYNLCE